MLKFAFKNMAIKRVQIILIVLSIVISAGIGVLAFNVATQVDEGITSGAQYYSAIVGPVFNFLNSTFCTFFHSHKGTARFFQSCPYWKLGAFLPVV